MRLGDTRLVPAGGVMLFLIGLVCWLSLADGLYEVSSAGLHVSAQAVMRSASPDEIEAHDPLSVAERRPSSAVPATTPSFEAPGCAPVRDGEFTVVLNADPVAEYLGLGDLADRWTGGSMARVRLTAREPVEIADLESGAALRVEGQAERGFLVDGWIAPCSGMPADWSLGAMPTSGVQVTIRNPGGLGRAPIFLRSAVSGRTSPSVEDRFAGEGRTLSFRPLERGPFRLVARTGRGEFTFEDLIFEGDKSCEVVVPPLRRVELGVPAGCALLGAVAIEVRGTGAEGAVGRVSDPLADSAPATLTCAAGEVTVGAMILSPDGSLQAVASAVPPGRNRVILGSAENSGDGHEPLLVPPGHLAAAYLTGASTDDLTRRPGRYTGRLLWVGRGDTDTPTRIRPSVPSGLEVHIVTWQGGISRERSSSGPASTCCPGRTDIDFRTDLRGALVVAFSGNEMVACGVTDETGRCSLAVPTTRPVVIAAAEALRGLRLARSAGLWLDAGTTPLRLNFPMTALGWQERVMFWHPRSDVRMEGDSPGATLVTPMRPGAPLALGMRTEIETIEGPQDGGVCWLVSGDGARLRRLRIPEDSACRVVTWRPGLAQAVEPSEIEALYVRGLDGSEWGPETVLEPARRRLAEGRPVDISVPILIVRKSPGGDQQWVRFHDAVSGSPAWMPACRLSVSVRSSDGPSLPFADVHVESAANTPVVPPLRLPCGPAGGVTLRLPFGEYRLRVTAAYHHEQTLTVRLPADGGSGGSSADVTLRRR